MKLISRIKPRMYCDSSLIWWNFNRGENTWLFVLAFWLFIGMLRISISKGMKVRVSFQR